MTLQSRPQNAGLLMFPFYIQVTLVAVWCRECQERVAVECHFPSPSIKVLCF